MIYNRHHHFHAQPPNIQDKTKPRSDTFLPLSKGKKWLLFPVEWSVLKYSLYYNFCNENKKFLKKKSTFLCKTENTSMNFGSSPVVKTTQRACDSSDIVMAIRFSEHSLTQSSESTFNNHYWFTIKINSAMRRANPIFIYETQYATRCSREVKNWHTVNAFFSFCYRNTWLSCNGTN